MIENLKSKNNLEVKKINGFLTHSLYDPDKEAIKFYEKNIEDVHVHIIYGYGSGYIIKKFLEKNVYKTFYVVIDPFINIENLTQNEYVKYIYSKKPKEIVDLISKYVNQVNQNIKFTCSPNYDKINPKLYKEILTEIKSFLSISKVNENTILNISYLWFENYLKNLQYKDSSIKYLQKKFTKGVIVASGGPSLTKQLETLKEYRKDYILISAGSTTNSLIKENIIPDIVVSVDGHELNYEHFKHLNFDEKTLFMYSMYSYPEIRKIFKNACYFMDGTGFELSKNLSEVKKEEVVSLAGSGSVAHYALILGIYISSGPVCLIGQDLAFLNRKTHAENNILGKELTLEEERSLIKVEGYYGDEVYTNNMFLSMKKGFENIMQNDIENEIFNCTEGGVLINGLPNLSFKHFCEKYKNSCKDMEEHLLIYKENSNNSQVSPLQISRDILSKYIKMKRLLIENLSLIQKSEIKGSFSTKVLAKLDKNDKSIRNISDQDIIEVAFQATSIKLQKNFKKDKNDDINEKFKKSIMENKFLYSEMKVILEVGIHVLEENIKELEV